MNDVKFEFPEGIQRMLQILNDNNFESYVVGGAIRDTLMGKRPKDYDITTNAFPMNVVRVFSGLKENFDVKFIDAESYKVVTVNGVEIATYRKDTHKNGKTVETVIVETLEEDLSRRDFTVNAMAVGLDGKLIDLFNGQKDLEDRCIRFVGEPRDRIIEDPDRMLRAARFVGVIGGYMEAESFNAMVTYRALIKGIAPERIRIEIIKTMLGAKQGSAFFNTLSKIDALDYIFPSLNNTLLIDGGKQHRETVWDHSMMTGDYLGDKYSGRCQKNPMLRLAGYLHDVGKSEPNFKDGDIHFYEHEDKGAEMVEEEMNALLFTIKETQYVKNLIMIHMNGNIKMSPKSTRKLLVKLAKGDLDHKDWIAMRDADRAANLAKGPITDKKINKLHKKFEHELNPESGDGRCPVLMKDLAISGKNIQDLLGIGPSQIVGVILQYLFDRSVIDPALNNREALEEMIIGKKREIKYV
jgi:tRNA nucleotidyltransferase (CCA-adding enzyme)